MQVHAKDTALWSRIADQPKSLSVLAKRGRGQYPRDWTKFHDDIQHATTDDQMARLWDVTTQGIEAKMLGRHDAAGPLLHGYEGRAREHNARWKNLRAVPQHRQPRPSCEYAAWSAAARRARPLRSVHIVLGPCIPNLDADTDKQPRRMQRVAKVLIDTEAFLGRIKKLDWVFALLDELTAQVFQVWSGCDR
eukprot:616748-Pyramimonas_sp.AAC.1